MNDKIIFVIFLSTITLCVFATLIFILWSTIDMARFEKRLMDCEEE